MPSNHLILCCPLLLLPSIFPSIRVLSNESALHIRWPKYWSFSFSISLSNQYSGLTSFRIDWFDLLAVQRTLKSLLQHHHLKASILWHSVFFMVQLSHLYMTAMVYSFDYMDLVQVGQGIRDPCSILTQWHNNNKRINTAHGNNGDRNGIQLQYKHTTKNNYILFQLSMNPGENNKFSNSPPLHQGDTLHHLPPLAQRSSRTKPIFSK